MRIGFQGPPALYAVAAGRRRRFRERPLDGHAIHVRSGIQRADLNESEVVDPVIRLQFRMKIGGSPRGVLDGEPEVQTRQDASRIVFEAAPEFQQGIPVAFSDDGVRSACMIAVIRAGVMEPDDELLRRGKEIASGPVFHDGADQRAAAFGVMLTAEIPVFQNES